MVKLVIPPSIVEFGTSHPSEVSQTPVVGGPARRRRVTIGCRAVVDCTWNGLLSADYVYMRAFYRAATANGSASFDIDMKITSPTLQLYEDVYFVPGSFRLNSKQGNVFSVSAQLVVNIEA